MPELAPGRIVRFVLSPTETLPAIVAAVTDAERGKADLIVFASGATSARAFAGGTRLFAGVNPDDEKKPGTWHWPER